MASPGLVRKALAPAWVRPEALNVTPDLLGMPLAPHGRRRRRRSGRTRRLRRRDAGRRVLEHQAVARGDAQARGRELEAVGRGLAAHHVLGGDQQRRLARAGAPARAAP